MTPNPARTLDDAVYASAPVGHNDVAGIKPPEQTLRSQLFVRSVFYEANDHPRYAANFLTEPVESGTPPDKEVVNRNANGSRLYLLI